MLSAAPGTHIPAHLVKLPGTAWQVWRWVAVRGAGHPAATVLSLEAPDAVAAADAVLDAEAGVELHVAVERRAQAEVEFDDAMSLGMRANNLSLRAAFADDALREALLWQNLALQDTLRSFLDRPDERVNSPAQEKERLFARYLQRYCVKNDTIGFFGPLGWAGLAPDHPRCELRVGDQLLSTRQTFFEGWAIDALARQIGTDARLRPWLAPRPLPTWYREGSTVHLPALATLARGGGLPPGLRSSVTLSPAQVQALTRCDGDRSASEIGAEMVRDPGLMLADQAAAFAVIDSLCDLGLVRWQLEVPLQLDADRLLRRRIERVQDVAARTDALAALDGLAEAKDTVSAAAGDPDALAVALRHLNEVFVTTTGVAPTRAVGKNYAARTLVYEDCRRDMQMTLGRPFLDALGPPLGLILASARWLTYQLAARFRDALTSIYTELAVGTARVIDFQPFAQRAATVIAGRGPEGIAASTERELQRRWAEILDVPNGRREVRYTTAEIRDAVEASFAAPHPGWSLARYCSPDVLVAAAQAGNIGAGPFDLVLGEVHLFNTLSRSYCRALHPTPGDLETARSMDLPPGVVPVPSSGHIVQRAAIWLVSSQDTWFAYDSTPPPGKHAQVVAIGELVVEQSTDGLRVRTRDRRFDIDVVEFFGYTLSNRCMTFPPIVAVDGHRPRLVVDGLVVAREAWSVSAIDLPFVFGRSRAERFLGARRWSVEASIPRLLFARVPTEQKPFFVDLNSPIFVDIFAKSVRSAAKNCSEPVHLTEMLPSFEGLWMHDAMGRRYTSELRLVALDPTSPANSNTYNRR